MRKRTARAREAPCADGDGLGLATRDRMRGWRPLLRQDTCISTGELVLPVTAGLHARPAVTGRVRTLL